MGKAEIAFYVCDQAISWAMLQKVINCCRGDKWQAGLLFYRARAAQAKNVMAWIGRGLLPPDRYAMRACRDEDDNQGAVRDWIETNVLKITPKTIGAIMRELMGEQ